jgi:hypothetical protein
VAKKPSTTKKKASKKKRPKGASSEPKKKATKKAAKKKAAKKKAKKKAAKKKAKKGVSKGPAKKKKGSNGTASSTSSPALSSAAKRKAILALVLPPSTAARTAKAAAASVWAISSEKTQDVRLKIRETDDALEEARAQQAAELVVTAPTADERRSSRDPFGFFRAELEREPLAPEDVYAPWRYSQELERHELDPGLSVAELDEVEAALGKTLPPSYYDFSLEWGGGELFTQPGGGYRVVSPADVVAEVRGPLCNRMLQPYLPVVALGVGDYLCLDMSRKSRGEEHAVHWWSGGKVQRRVSDSFGAWMRKVIELRGEPFWWSV